MKIKSITIIGLGLIGGSLVKALKRTKSFQVITGIDINTKSLDCALKEGVLDKAYTVIDENIKDSDMVIICTPINKILSCIKEVTKFVKQDCIITDTGSIKGNIIKEIDNLDQQFNFIGGHPMCGSEKCNYEASKEYLFENAYYILTPCTKTFDNTIDIMKQIIIAIGGIPVVIEQVKHDMITGTISHVPHIVSALLVNLVKEFDCEKRYMQKLAAGGFKDITRISSSEPKMWQGIVLNNKGCIKDILQKFTKHINTIISWLDKNDTNNIYKFFESAKEFRDTFTSKNMGLITSVYDLSVDIKDKPGELAKLTTLLGNNFINITNINIANSREYEQGCLRLTFLDSEGMNKAYNLLKSKGYMVYKMQ